MAESTNNVPKTIDEWVDLVCEKGDSKLTRECIAGCFKDCGAIINYAELARRIIKIRDAIKQQEAYKSAATFSWALTNIEQYVDDKNKNNKPITSDLIVAFLKNTQHGRAQVNPMKDIFNSACSTDKKAPLGPGSKDPTT
jgi:hypothetical protein